MRRARGAVAAGALLLLTSLPGILQAQANPAGRWITLETAHLNLHVRAEQRAEGLRAARIAEAAWARLARELEPPSARIEIVLTDSTDATNGFGFARPVRGRVCGRRTFVLTARANLPAGGGVPEA